MSDPCSHTLTNEHSSGRVSIRGARGGMGEGVGGM
jgi:hypothetical protein